MTEPTTNERYAVDDLVSDVAAVFAAVGVPDEHARLVADSLVTAEAWGHPSHGLLRVRWYVDRIEAGLARPGVLPEKVVDAGAVALLDGRDGIGQVVTYHAMQDAIGRSRAHGVGVVSVRDSNHFGTAAYYTRRAAEQGAVAMLATNSSPAMAPWGGRENRFGANPWSLAAPTGSHGPVVMDISNTAVARGKIYAAREQGVEIPDGWAMDAEGRPTTDPVEAAAGLLMPMGGHKGYAISFMMDVLAGVLSGSASGREVRGPQQAEHRSRCGHLVLALDVEAFGDAAGFAQRMDRLVEEAHSTPLAEGTQRILVPGELEAGNAERAAQEGVAVATKTLEDLRAVAAERGVELTSGQ